MLINFRESAQINRGVRVNKSRLAKHDEPEASSSSSPDPLFARDKPEKLIDSDSWNDLSSLSAAALAVLTEHLY